jgi:hypothetical protein
VPNPVEQLKASESRTVKNPRVVALLLSASLLACGIGPANASSDKCAPTGRGVEESHACKVARLKKRSFVVVAVIDSGIDPYHADFQLAADDDMRGVHPSEFVDGFPREAEELELSLDLGYQSAVAADEGEWDSVQPEMLYTMPGTKIIGGITFDDAPIGPGWGGRILDEVDGHGTATASLVAGMTHSIRPDEDVLLVAIQGLGEESVEWAVKQPWIDVVSNSWGQRANAYRPEGSHPSTRRWVEEQGGTFVVSAGNGASGYGLCDRAVTTTSWMTGPPWHLIVGAVSGWNKQPSCYSSIPPDVSSYGNRVEAALAGSNDASTAFQGTSAAAPLVSGAMAVWILESRRALHDHHEGPQAGSVASAGRRPKHVSKGPLRDGDVTREEVEAAVLKTAIVYPFDPSQLPRDPMIWPGTPFYYIYEGYGVVNARSLRRALGVLRGAVRMPERADVDSWIELKDTVGSIWYTLP